MPEVERDTFEPIPYPKTYITASPDKQQWVEGYVAGMMGCAEDMGDFEIVLDPECPRDKIYMTSKPIEQNTDRTQGDDESLGT